MRKNIKQLMAAGCCAALLVTGGALSAFGGTITAGESQQTEQAQPEQPAAPEFVGVWGPVLRVTEDRIYIDNLSENAVKGEVAITISEEHSRVVEAVNGFPVALSDLREGDFVYGYLGPAMTLSLPPIANGRMIICKAPADFKVPEYIRVTATETLEDGSVRITGSNGNTYVATEDTVTLPYLTRQMVRLEAVTKDRTCLIWSDENNQATKIVLFAPDVESDMQ